MKFILLLLLVSCGPKVNHKLKADPIKIEMPENFTMYQSIALKRMYEELVYICIDLHINDTLKLDTCKEDAKKTIDDIINEMNRELI